MVGATHFIEVYKIPCVLKLCIYPNFCVEDVYAKPIKELGAALKRTENLEQITVAIWYIKPLIKSKQYV